MIKRESHRHVKCLSLLVSLTYKLEHDSDKYQCYRHKIVGRWYQDPNTSTGHTSLLIRSIRFYSAYLGNRREGIYLSCLK